MSALTDQVEANAHAQAIAVWRVNMEQLEQKTSAAIIKDRDAVRAFLMDYPELKEVLIVNDNGMAYVPSKPKSKELDAVGVEITEEPKVHTNGKRTATGAKNNG